MKNKQIELIPVLDACDFPHELEKEMVDNNVNTHYQNDILHLNWKEGHRFPLTKKWLIDTYGSEIKNYTKFAIIST